MAINVLSGRHIQNYSEAQALEPHWGYADRVIPCTNDIGSCHYLDSVYHSHDLGMIYTGIIWGTVGAILLIVGLGRRMHHASRDAPKTGLEKFLPQVQRPPTTLGRIKSTVTAFTRRYLLPESTRSIFGRTSRLQVSILFVIVVYLTIWSFVGITYQRWITPVKKLPGVFNTRTGLGPFSDRVGVLAYALLPFSVMLSSRESLLSLITGIPYQHFNFLHRWLGYVILVQSLIHTIGWTIIETKLYQPQPKVGVEWIKQLYMIWGIVAQLFMVFLFILSLKPVIKLTGYEFFRKAHYVLAMLFIGACWGHWEQLKCFLLPALLLWFIDRGVRLVRTWLIHYQVIDGKMGCVNAKAKITHFPDEINGDVVRLDFDFPHDEWKVGQHFYLCFPELSIWQSHPFTPLSLPRSNASKQQHSYIVRAKNGETKKLAQLAQLAHKKVAPQKSQEKTEEVPDPSTAAVLTGPYGENIMTSLEYTTNVLCVAGGTGVTYVLPVLLHLAQQPSVEDRKVDFVWAVRMESDIEWIRHELEILARAATTHGISTKIYVTRECCAQVSDESERALVKNAQVESSSTSSDDEVRETSKFGHLSISKAKSTSTDHILMRPDLTTIVSEFVQNTVGGSTIVFASGPGSMISDLRETVAQSNSASKVWRGDSRYNVDLICDNRLEW